MAENTNIEWCHHTINLWWGCAKVHTGCKNCYAETLAKRYKNDVWGEKKLRKPIKSALNLLEKYQKLGAKEGRNFNVFTGSMMDIFEASKGLTFKYNGCSSTGELRADLFNRIEAGEYPNINFLFLTKRPENIELHIPAAWEMLGVPKNVWFGVSISDQQTADQMMPEFLKVQGKKFLSIEPQVGPIDILKHLRNPDGTLPYHWPINWIIQGGESGHNRRPFNLDWADSMRAQCREAGIPYFFKQIDKVQKIPSNMFVQQLPKSLS